MSDVIAFCGFFGAWLLVIGPLGQAVRELEEEEFERDSLARAAQQVEKPPGRLGLVVACSAGLLRPVPTAG